jgi:hypothetical protein
LLQTDYSGEGISAILSQEFEDGEHPTAYWSKANKGAQKRYHATVGECYAVVQGIKHFRSYLLGNVFSVVTDHKALKWLLDTKGENAQLFRWCMIIQEFMPFNIAWREGRKHGNSDVLSRFPIRHVDDVLITETVFDLYSLAGREKLIQMQRNDRTLEQCRNFLTKSELPADKMQQRFIVAICKYIYLWDNCLWHAGNTEELVPKIIEMAHEEVGHFGPAKTLSVLKSRCYWPRMNQDIAAGKMESDYEATRPWDMICVDWIGPINPPQSRFKYILVVVDYYTRWVEAFPTVDKSAITFANVLNKEVFARNFYPCTN